MRLDALRVKGHLKVVLADHYQKYLVKAEEAERQAKSAADERAKESWLKVAAGYRDLAHMAQSRCAKRN